MKNNDIKRSMDDTTKDNIVLVDTKGNTLGEIERKPKREAEPDVKPAKKPNKSKKTKKKANKKAKAQKEERLQKEERTQKEKRPRREEKVVEVRNDYDERHKKANPKARRRLSRRERLKERRKAIAAFIAEVILGLAILIIGGVLFAFFACNINEVVVEGNNIYTEEEIRDYVVDGKYPNNCVYEVVHNFFEPKKDIPFIDKAKVSMAGLNTLKITVSERIPFGYVIDGETPLPNEGDASAVEGEQPASEETSVEQPEEGYNFATEESSDNSGSLEDSGKERIKNGIAKYFNEDGVITDISDIRLPQSTFWKDMTSSGEKVGDKVTDDEVKLSSYLDTAKSLKANNIFLNSIWVDDNHNIFGQKDNIKINFGLKNDMDDKCKRLSVILPTLENQSGTLHLENFSPGNTDIVFKKEM